MELLEYVKLALPEMEQESKPRNIFETESDLLNQISDLVEQISRVQSNLDFNEDMSTTYRFEVDMFTKEIEKMKENPLNYPIGAGAGTIKQNQDRLDELKKTLQEINEYRPMHRQALDDLKEQYEQLLFILGSRIGLETLKEERKRVDLRSNDLEKQQKDSYLLQKHRYVSCKNNGVFTKEDREFIRHHKEINERCKEEWESMYDYREKVNELIKILDPSDLDTGFHAEGL